MKIGIYGGSFNPVHKGHVHLAKNALDKLGLDKVILIPGATPPHKSAVNMVSGKHRINMLSLATEGIKGLEISDIELKRSGISYTAETIDQLMTIEQGEYYLIMGADMYSTIKSWHRFEDIISKVTIVGAARSKGEEEKLENIKLLYQHEGIKTIVLSYQILPASSSQVRNGEEELLDEQVASYIKQNKLYQYADKNYDYPLDEYRNIIKGLVDEERYIHTLNVADEARILGEIWGADPYICYVAGLLHDIAKCMDNKKQIQYLEKTSDWNDPIFRTQKKIWHGFSGAEYLKTELKLYNCEILEAIRYHSTGKAGMSLLDKIIYVADLTSKERVYPDADVVRSLSRTDLDEATAYILKYTIDKLIRLDSPLFLDTILAYNSFRT